MLHSSRARPTVGGIITTAALGLAFSPTIQAAGFALIEQGVQGLGTAYAGAAATADAVETLYFNPAGMTRLPGTQTGAAVHLILPENKFSNRDTTFSPLVGGAPIPGSNGGDTGSLAAVPNAYLTHQLNDQTWLGFAINVPFGLTTEYDDDWVGRYHAIKSEVKTLNFNPSIAFKPNDQLSLAVGLSAMYIEGEFTNAIDFGTLNVIPAGLGGLGGALGPIGPGQADGSSRITGDSWGWGFNLGALYEFSDATRLGIHFRSKVKQNLKGDADFKVPAAPLGAVFSDTDVKADVDLPATLSLSGVHQLNPEWSILADYTWTGWSSIPELRFGFGNGLPDAVTTFDWKDTSRLALGTTYQPTGSRWTYRFGMAYDESPIRNAETRSARLPDDDRTWVAIGAGFQASPQLKFNVAYSHLFIDDAEIAKDGTGEDVTRGALNGVYDTKVDILSFDVQYRF